MKPREKAEQLVDKLTLSSNAQDGSWMCEDLAKKCALIAVDEILLAGKDVDEFADAYWQEVKLEIEKYG